MLLNLDFFTYASSLDLRMGYYHIDLSPRSKQIYTIVLPWGKYEYQKLPMKVCNSPNIYQENVSKLFDASDMVRAYIDDVLIITKNNSEEHLKSLDKVLQRLAEAGLKINAEKYFLGKIETEYLGLWVINNGVRLLSYKVKAIKSINIPTKVLDVHRFVGLVNYYRDMWCRSAYTLSPLTKIFSTKVKFKWTDVENNAFTAMKNIVGRYVLLS